MVKVTSKGIIILLSCKFDGQATWFDQFLIMKVMFCCPGAELLDTFGIMYFSLIKHTDTGKTLKTRALITMQVSQLPTRDAGSPTSQKFDSFIIHLPKKPFPY